MLDLFRKKYNVRSSKPWSGKRSSVDAYLWVEKESVWEGEHATTFGMEKSIQQPLGHYYTLWSLKYGANSANFFSVEFDFLENFLFDTRKVVLFYLTLKLEMFLIRPLYQFFYLYDISISLLLLNLM